MTHIVELGKIKTLARYDPYVCLICDHNLRPKYIDMIQGRCLSAMMLLPAHLPIGQVEAETYLTEVISAWRAGIHFEHCMGHFSGILRWGIVEGLRYFRQIVLGLCFCANIIVQGNYPDDH